MANLQKVPAKTLISLFIAKIQCVYSFPLPTSYSIQLFHFITQSGKKKPKQINKQTKKPQLTGLLVRFSREFTKL